MYSGTYVQTPGPYKQKFPGTLTMARDVLPEEYLREDFDYTKLTKNQLRKIMYENGVEEVPPLTCRKSELLDAYRNNIHSRIDVLSRKGEVSMENPFQQTPSKRRPGNVFVRIPDTPGRTQGRGDRLQTGTRPLRRTDGLRRRDGGHMASESSSTIDHSNGDLNSPFGSSLLDAPRDRRSPSPHREGTGKLKREASISDPTLDKASDTSSASTFTSTPSKTIKSLARRSKGRTWGVGRLGMTGSVLGASAVCVFVYLRFFCPYCRDDEFFCIQPPEHSRVVDGRLVCSEGFVVKRGIMKTYCVKDDRHEREVEREVGRIRRELERRSGDFLYGMAPTRTVTMSLLTRDAEVIERLRKEAGVVVSGDTAHSTSSRISVRTFVRYYARRTAVCVIPLVVAVFVIRTMRSYSRRKRERHLTARKIVKDVVDVLVRQIYVSAKNANFPSHVYVEQLRDCFGVDRKVWREVEGIVLSNSNIREIHVVDKKAWEWVGPILYKPEFNGGLV